MRREAAAPCRWHSEAAHRRRRRRRRAGDRRAPPPGRRRASSTRPAHLRWRSCTTPHRVLAPQEAASLIVESLATRGALLVGVQATPELQRLVLECLGWHPHGPEIDVEEGALLPRALDQESALGLQARVERRAGERRHDRD